MQPKIRITLHGPYVVTGQVPLSQQAIQSDAEGASVGYKVLRNFPPQEETRLCRCGHSQNKPFCDGSHLQVKFDGTETASSAPFLDQVDEVTDGQDIELLGVSHLCAAARFCHPHGGTWDMVAAARTPGETKAAVAQACACPSGRLVARDKKTGKLLEEQLPPAIVALEDEPAGKMGPLAVRGGIPVASADGKPYPARMRMTLCRCGRSKNKPFCDASHLDDTTSG